MLRRQEAMAGKQTSPPDNTTRKTGPESNEVTDGPRLRVVSAQGTATFPLRLGSLVLGRGADVDLCVEDDSISRRHATLHVGSTIEVEDLGSSNGTRVRDRTLKPGERATVSPGDVLGFGRVLCTVLRPPRSQRSGASETQGVVVEAENMRALHENVRKAARSQISVLLLGETGVGKEVVAEQIHRLSPRASKPFVRFNCAAFAETLIESELFGYVKGAFTGAVADKQGLLEAAQGGTAFFDEVGELPLSLQARLLRVLEERKVRRVGALQERAIDVRFLAATNRDLDAEVRARRFREDLLHRLNPMTITIPPLRERVAEVAPLARRFVALAAQQSGLTEVPEITDAAMEILARHRWPGNVRELKNVMERAVVLAEGGAVGPEHLPLERFTPARSPKAPAVGGGSLQEERDAAERERIREALVQVAGNQSRAAEILGISRRMFLYLLDKHGLPRPRKK